MKASTKRLILRVIHMVFVIPVLRYFRGLMSRVAEFGLVKRQVPIDSV